MRSIPASSRLLQIQRPIRRRRIDRELTGFRWTAMPTPRCNMRFRGERRLLRHLLLRRPRLGESVQLRIPGRHRCHNRGRWRQHRRRRRVKLEPLRPFVLGSDVEDRAIDRPAIDRQGWRVRHVPTREQEQREQHAADTEEISSKGHGLPFHSQPIARIQSLPGRVGSKKLLHRAVSAHGHLP